MLWCIKKLLQQLCWQCSGNSAVPWRRQCCCLCAHPSVCLALPSVVFIPLSQADTASTPMCFCSQISAPPCCCLQVMSPARDRLRRRLKPSDSALAMWSRSCLWSDPLPGHRVPFLGHVHCVKQGFYCAGGLVIWRADEQEDCLMVDYPSVF